MIGSDLSDSNLCIELSRFSYFVSIAMPKRISFGSRNTRYNHR